MHKMHEGLVWMGRGPSVVSWGSIVVWTDLVTKITQPNHLGLNILFFIGKLRLNLVFFVLPGFWFHYFLSGSGFIQRATYISETSPTEKK